MTWAVYESTGIQDLFHTRAYIKYTHTHTHMYAVEFHFSISIGINQLKTELIYSMLLVQVPFELDFMIQLGIIIKNKFFLGSFCIFDASTYTK